MVFGSSSSVWKVFHCVPYMSILNVLEEHHSMYTCVCFVYMYMCCKLGVVINWERGGGLPCAFCVLQQLQ